MPEPMDRDPEHPPQGGRLADRISDRLLRGLIGGAMRLPYERRVAAMGWITAKGVAPVVGYRRRARTHLEQIWPEMPAVERRRLADQVSDNFGRTLIENYSHRELGQRLAGQPVTGEGIEALRTAKAAGRPVIFVTGHFGNHEAPRHVLHAMGYRIGGLYKPMANPYFNAHYARTMADISGPVFEKGRRGTMGFARHLAAGGMATLLFDLYDYGGAEIDFLGRPAPTSTSAADLALRFDAEVIPYFGRRRENGLSFDILIEAPIPHADPLAMTVEMTRRLEARVRADPGQWFWIHNRWKPERRRG